MRIFDRLASGSTADIRVHRAAWNRTGADECDFDRQIVETSRLQTRQGSDLGAAFYLKHPDRIGAAQHVVDRRLLAWDSGQLPALTKMLGHQIKGGRHRTEHAQPQKIEYN